MNGYNSRVATLSFPGQGSRSAAQRLGMALGVSLAVHGVLLFVLKALPQAGLASERTEFIPARLMQVSLPGRPQPVAAPPEPVPVEETPAEIQVKPQETPPVQKPEPVVSPPKTSAPPAPPQQEKTPATVSAPVTEDPTYYPARQVDVTPQSLVHIEPVYPDDAASRGIQGYVTLLLYVDESGMVRTAEVADANPEGVFDQSALDAFRNARFKPAIRNGVAVKSRVLIRVRYDLDRRGGDGSRSSSGISLTPVAPQAAPQPGKGSELAVANKCFTCHAMDKNMKMLGPAFREIAVRYKGQDKAAAKMFDKLKHGMGETAYWQVHATPPDADLKAIVEWITGL